MPVLRSAPAVLMSALTPVLMPVLTSVLMPVPAVLTAGRSGAAAWGFGVWGPGCVC
ncbi:hypothetical protein POF50_018560 [Streptomyces sp. SL13]|uniref:Uncharacterized protein n=1 Tax=Streptantibioticus silvisoli TaxID=2705255 RepID=A0AA90H3I2_9ACTN|nr:hypothetical protein [Streptantibioticus silvisoli]MDI5971316.1 hypothetical protein [Streptantibioticus silvisoli]